MSLPAELLAVARQVREVFGDSVKLRHAAWPDGEAGNLAWDCTELDHATTLQTNGP